MDNTIEESFFRKLVQNKVVRFFLSAGVGFIVDATIYFLIYNYFFHKKDLLIAGIHFTGDVTSLVVSFTCGVITNFLITKFLVFTESDLAAYRQFLRFAVVAVVGFFANLLVLKLLVNYFNFYPPLARVTAALTLGIASYFIHRAFSFNIKKDE
jgi:putative flippase GtrA